MKALDVSKYILNKCTVESQPISNLQLQKILYYVQHEFLVKYNKALFEDDFAAWKFGPIIPFIYHIYSTAGGMKIDEKYDDISMALFKTEDLQIIDSVVEKHRIRGPWDLVDETHKEGKARDKIFNKGTGFKQIISKELIKECAF